MTGDVESCTELVLSDQCLQERRCSDQIGVEQGENVGDEDFLLTVSSRAQLLVHKVDAFDLLLDARREEAGVN